eukprot:CAMPEP_0116936288 /NCGR_PEP_ID=MMETSP0467-20121206/30798_1 /TAXON_ID=283647 /ORGANISM="Mesodinium pulex, Strain SPMC105" /LENGTH=135 /DNA_ID=CAMNT_0004617841 /DNA_START=746 /DNA_END=1153 /DNA_ORIENTATION=-
MILQFNALVLFAVYKEECKFFELDFGKVAHVDVNSPIESIAEVDPVGHDGVFVDVAVLPDGELLADHLMEGGDGHRLEFDDVFDQTDCILSIPEQQLDLTFDLDVGSGVFPQFVLRVLRVSEQVQLAEVGVLSRE